MGTTIVPRVGDGRFQWNIGAWFGSVIGGNSWMIVAAGFLLVYQQSALAAIAIGGFILTNVAAWGMWKRRNRLDPFRALMAVLGLMAVTLPVVWFTVSAWASPEVLAKMNWPASTFLDAAIPLLVPACMAWFYILEHRAKSAQSRRRATG